MERPEGRPASDPRGHVIDHAARPQAQADEWLVKTLVDTGIADRDRAAALLLDCTGATVWQRALDLGLGTDATIVAAIAGQYRVREADLASADPQLTALIPESLARKHHILALGADDRRIRVATADPRDFDTEQAVRFVTGRDVLFEVAAPGQIQERLDTLYRPERSIERLLDRLEPGSVEAVNDSPVPESRDPVLDGPVAKLVDAMICEGVRQGASDIHAEPEEGATVVRYRVDGVLREVMRLPSSAGASLVRRAKIFAKLDVTDPLHPHDGRAAIRVDGQQVDLRVSTVPIARRGEKVVIRILDKTNLRANVGELGLCADERALLERLLGFREGMLLVTGPTGSGKTTTLYAALNELKTGRVNIVTVEDPVEYDLSGISQIQVNEAQGLTFSSALRSVLRQDPDIVLVGEIRDQETARTAIQAGLCRATSCSRRCTPTTRPPPWSDSATWASTRSRSPRCCAAFWPSGWCGGSALECAVPDRSREPAPGCQAHSRSGAARWTSAGRLAARPAAAAATRGEWGWWRSCPWTRQSPGSLTAERRRTSSSRRPAGRACVRCGRAASTGCGRVSPRSRSWYGCWASGSWTTAAPCPTGPAS